MSQDVKMCAIEDSVVERLRAFRRRKEKTTAAIILKIDMEKMVVGIDEEYEDTTIEEIREDLPTHLPRYVVISYVLNHPDGRVSYPLIFVFISPSGTKPQLQMSYAGSKLALVNELEFSKVLEIRSTEELTDEYLQEKLFR